MNMFKLLINKKIESYEEAIQTICPLLSRPFIARKLYYILYTNKRLLYYTNLSQIKSPTEKSSHIIYLIAVNHFLTKIKQRRDFKKIVKMFKNIIWPKRIGDKNFYDKIESFQILEKYPGDSNYSCIEADYYFNSIWVDQPIRPGDNDYFVYEWKNFDIGIGVKKENDNGS